MVRPREDPWGLFPSLRLWEAWGSLMDLCGRFRPVGPPRLSCDAYVGRVCHRHCGGDRRSRHPVRLVWANGSFGCRAIPATTRDLILDTILAIQASTAPYLSYHGNVMGHLTARLYRYRSAAVPLPQRGYTATAARLYRYRSAAVPVP